MNTISNFITNPANNIWIDIGIVLFVVLLAGITFFLNSNYFHFISSTTLIIFGFTLLFWGNINKALIGLYDSALSSPTFSDSGKELLLFLKINLILNKVLFFLILFVLVWFLETIVYFVFLKKYLQIYPTSKQRFFINFSSKLLVFGLMLIGFTYLLTPIYLFTTKFHDENTIQKSNSYLQRTFQKLKILKVTNQNNNPFEPIWDDLVYINNLKKADLKSIQVNKIRTHLHKINDFLKTNHPTIYKQSWIDQTFLTSGHTMKSLLEEEKKSKLDYSSIENIQETIKNISKKYFLFLPAIK